MAMTLTDLIASVASSVQEARRALEESAVELYFSGFERKESPQGDTIYEPITREVSLPNNARDITSKHSIHVPVTALMEHNSLTLEQVELHMHVLPCEQDGTLTFCVQPLLNEEGEARTALPCSELTLTFRQSPPPEGMARLNQQSVQAL